jgi:hypothetical protein
MQTTVAIENDRRGEPSGTDPLGRRLGAALWLLPVFGAVTLWATLTHQPSPTTEFASWARFVTTDEFLAQHLEGRIYGLALNVIGVAALTAVVLLTGRRARAATWGFVLTVLGSAGLLAGFGVAAFAQPAIGNLEIQQFAGAHGVYDDIYGIPTFVTLIGGGVLFAIATVLLARATAAIDGVPRWARLTYGASGPFNAVLGVAVGPAQTIGSLAAIASGTAIALAFHRAGTAGATATP